VQRKIAQGSGAGRSFRGWHASRVSPTMNGSSERTESRLGRRSHRGLDEEQDLMVVMMIMTMAVTTLRPLCVD
jgi:hypothetical protein